MIKVSGVNDGVDKVAVYCKEHQDRKVIQAIKRRPEIPEGEFGADLFQRLPSIRVRPLA